MQRRPDGGRVLQEIGLVTREGEAGVRIETAWSVDPVAAPANTALQRLLNERLRQ